METSTLASTETLEPYLRSVLTARVLVSINDIGSNVRTILTQKIAHMTENRCIEEGFVRPGSVSVLTYTAGVLELDGMIITAVYEADVCLPTEGTKLKCTVRTLTKAGIHALVVDENGTVPVTVFVAKEHHHTDAHFAAISEGDVITVYVVGVRFEINDDSICAIATLESDDM